MELQHGIPEVAQYQPAVQTVWTVTPAGQKFPAVQVTLELVVEQKDPAGHVGHCADKPVDALYVPVAQADCTVTPTGQKLPAGHVAMVLGLAQNDPAGHEGHAAVRPEAAL